ncbi:MAG: hypothetical protein IJ389_05780 [Clostridia bacterium]|nr:hypothetical protein [Clostridia bacterium]
MKSHYRISHRVLAAFLSVIFVLSMIPLFALNAAAAQGIVREADPSTMNDWKKYFGSQVGNTTNAGGVWTDKSVFIDASAFSEAGVTMTDPDSNFLVALSAIASSKQIVGYSNIPTDTMLVLDMSGSMSNTSVSNMVTATNDAIRKLQATNNYNRVGVVLYSGNSSFGDSATSTAEVILPLDRWIEATDRYGRNVGFVNADNGTVSVRSGVENEDGDVSFTNYNRPSKDSDGGTYIQNGLWQAWKEFEGADDKVIADGFQAGTKRLPIMVLMSDGAPTAATNNYTDIGRSNIGDGGNSCATDAVGFITQLTAGYVKAKMEEAYGRSALFYTLGLGVDSLEAGQAVAESVLDSSKSTNAIKGYWDTFLRLSANQYYQSMTMTVPDTRTSTQNVQITYNDMFKAELVDGNYESAYEDYVDKYVEADSSADLIGAFEDIVNEIIIQSKYYSTLIENGDKNFDGYITINDEIGEYMDVKDIKGIVMGNTLFSGKMLASMLTEGDLGTIENPTAKGDIFVNSVRTRLNLTKEQAQDLIDDAYTYGQLSYNQTTGEFSNKICWYADADNNYLGFWHEELGYDMSNAPAGATHIIHSYGFLGDTFGSIKDSDMMYCSVQIRYEIATGKETVWWRIPAVLVPMAVYSITLEGDSVDNATNIEMTCTDTDPIRLVYEVGVQDGINELTVAEVMKDAGTKHKTDDGKYQFWSNRWGNEEDGGFDYDDPHTHLATTSEFSPSLENERYYYHEDTPVYRKTLTGYERVAATETIDQSATYYHRRSIFVNTGDGNEAEIRYVYEEITSESLAKASIKDLEGTTYDHWFIPKGNPYRLLGDFVNEKTENVTDSLVYSNYPIIHYHNVDGFNEYRADAFLGNNGRLTITPATGLKVTKQIDVVSPDTNTDFRFEVELSHATEALAASYPYQLFNGAGEKVGEGLAAVTDGKISFTLPNTYSVYITDLPDGTEYTVSEKAHVDYVLHSVNGDTDATVAQGTVELYSVDEATFVNTLKEHGVLVVSKKVLHPFGDAYAIPEDIKFTVEVTLEGIGVAGVEFPTSAGYYIETDSNGKFTIDIGADESIAIHDIPEGTKYTIDETSIPEGFAIDTSSTGLVGIIPGDANIGAELVNRYNPQSVKADDITLTGTKTLDGRVWLDTDEFTFELQRYVDTEYVTVASETVNSDDRSFDFTDELQAQVFDTIGIYQFKILEVKGSIGGVTYDSVQRYFHVTVTDTDMDGKLEISSVSVTPPVVMTTSDISSGVQYDLVADFTNTYAPTGSAQAFIEIYKDIENDTGIAVDLSGFKFALYNEEGELVSESVETNALGYTAIGLTYTTAYAGRTRTYTLKEVVPEDADKIPGMTYTDKEYTIEVTITDMLDGTVAATAKVIGAEESEYDNQIAVTFTNIYDLEDARLELEANKTLTGRDLADGEFSFEIFAADADFNITGSALQTKTNASGKVSFDAFTYSSVGTYYYVVREVKGSLGGVTYDETEYRVTVVVEKGEGAALKATVSYTDGLGVSKNSMTFENEYVPTPITHTIDGTKSLTGRDLADGEFTFALYNANASFETVGNPIDTATNTDGKFAFDEITYNVKGTHHYVVREVKGSLGGIIYDETEYHVTVTVTDNGDGTLSVSQSIEGASSISFANTYDPADAQVDLSGTKSLSGRDMVAGEFKFDLYIADDSFNLGEVVESAYNAANGTITFTSLTFDKAGVYYYTIKEDTSASLGGVEYDSAQFNIRIEVTDDGKGTLTAVTSIVKSDGSVSDVIFENKYVPTPVEVTLEGTKNLTGRDLEADEFTFELYEANENFAELGGAIDTKTNGANGKFTFDALTYTAKGTYRYLVKEVKGTLGGVKYDTTVYCVTVEVTDDGKGTLTATKTITVLDGGENASAIVFNNEYTAKSTSEALSAVKTLTGRGLKAGEFTFELYDANANYVKDQLLQTKTNASDGSITFDSVTYTEAGDYYYVIVEKAGSLGGVTYDESIYGVKVTVTDDGKGNLESAVSYALLGSTSASAVSFAEFKNTYKADATEIVISGSKTLTGRDIKDGEFKFDIFSADSSFNISGNAVKTASNNADGTFAFEAITFESAGTYYFVVREDDAASLGGVTYDKRSYKVTVTVTDNGEGQLEAEYVAELSGNEADIVFENKYNPASTSFDLSGLKTLSGRPLNAGEFQFVLYNADSAYVKSGDLIEKVSNGADGKFAFSAVTLDKVGTYYYVVVEESGSLGGVGYDKTVYGVKVTVADNLTGDLVATVEITNRTSGEISTILFANTYVPAGTEVILSGTKTLSGRTMKAGEFTFELYSATANYEAEGSALQSVANAADGSFAFEAIEYDAAGTYYYVVTEQTGSAGGVKYDETVYGVKVVVTDDLEGALVAETTIVNMTTGENAAILFANTYTPDGTTATVSGVKRLDGRTLKADEFTFELYSATSAYEKTGTALQSVTNKADGSFSFDAITLDETGTFYYVVVEKAGDAGGVTYDETVYGIKITVTDNGEGNLVAESVIVDKATGEEKAILFVNTYKPAPTSVTVDGDKTLNGREINAGEFKFELYETGDNFAVAGAPIRTATNDKNGYFVFDDIEYDAVGTYYYVVRENSSAQLGGITYDSTEYAVVVNVTDDGNGKLVAEKIVYKSKGASTAEKIVFVNTYDPDSVSVTYTGVKVLDGRPLKAGEFTFLLYKSDSSYTVQGDALQSVTNNGNGAFAFDALTFSETGTYYYAVAEKTGSAGGVKYDQTVYGIKIVVTDNNTGNLVLTSTIVDKVTDSESTLLFTNTYAPSETEVVISGTKELSGRELNEGEFTFQLYGATDSYVQNGEAIDSVTNSAKGSFSFKAVKFDRAGTYYYVVVEKTGDAGGVAYDQTVYGVKVVVEDDLNGALVPTTTIVNMTTDEEAPILFVNTYTPAGTAVNLNGVKTLSGRDLVENEFTFEVYSANANYVADGSAILTATNGADGAFEFDALTFDKVGTYYYVVTEKAGSAGGVTYDKTIYGVKVVVTDNKKGQLVAETTVINTDSGEESTLLFANSYKPASVEVTLEASKALTGRELNANEFRFELFKANSNYEISGEAIAAATNTADGKIIFDAQLFDAVGTYYYVIAENDSAALGGITYDKSKFGVKITVTDDGKGSLEADVQMYKAGVAVDEIKFANVYTPASTAVTLNGVKTLNGRELKAGEFTFKLHESNAVHSLQGEVIEAVVNNADGSFSFSALTYNKVGTYYYLITEEDGGLGGVFYDLAEYAITVTVTDNLAGGLVAKTTVFEKITGEEKPIIFVNNYVPKGTEVVVSGTKTLSGRDLVESEFVFELYNANSKFEREGDPIRRAFNAQNGEFSFRALSFDKVGTYYYVVAERSGSLGGVSYDDTVYGIKVVVTDDLAGALVAKTTVTVKGSDDEAAIIFANAYAPKSTTVTVDGVKTLSGRDMKAGEFTFELYNASSDYVVGGDAVRTVKNNADGSFTFDALTFDKVGTYYYAVVEKTGSAGGVTYDKTVYGIKVVVTDDLKGNLVASVTVVEKESGEEKTIIFANSYVPADVDVTLSGTKTLTGRELNEGEFRFDLYAADDSFNKVGDVLRIAANTVDGTFTFDALTYDKVGTYRYVVLENSDAQLGGVTYDKTVYNVTVTVTDDLNGNLVADVEINKADGSAADDGLAFVNTYKPASTTVDLGGVKTLSGRDMNLGEFKFELYRADSEFNMQGDALRVAYNGTDGTFSFDSVSFDATGTYYFVIVEHTGDAGGVTYDTNVYRVTVVVTDNLTGNLVASTSVADKNGVVGEDAIIFANSYTPKSTDVVLSGIKTLSGRDMNEGEFEFVLFGANAEFEADGDALEAVANTADGAFTFTALTFDKVGTYYYTVVESDGEAGGVAYDKTAYNVTVTVTDDLLGNLVAKVDIAKGDEAAEVIAFANTYTPESVSVTVDGVKKLDGRTLKAGEFKFEIFEADSELNLVGEAVRVALNKADGSFSFDALEFTEVGTYYFAVTENASDALHGVTYDDAVYYITVVVTDNLEGNLLAEVSVSRGGEAVDTVVFANTFVPDDITVDIEVGKTVDNKSEEKIGPEGFKFTLTDSEGNVIGTVVTDKDGKAILTLTYGADDIGRSYVYKLSEVNTGVENVTYSQEVYDITVVISQDESGQLVATVKVNGEETESPKAEFVNIYELPEKPEAPQTGDSPLFIYWALMLLSGGGLVATVIYDRKKKAAK